MTEPTNTGWHDALEKIARADDLHISPLRDDNVTFGTPTWIWSVVVNNELFVRAYHGQKSSWYQAAMKQKEGKVTVAGMTKNVRFIPVDGPVNNSIDEAYREKYESSPYLNSMISDRARSATVRIVPK